MTFVLNPRLGNQIWQHILAWKSLNNAEDGTKIPVAPEFSLRFVGELLIWKTGRRSPSHWIPKEAYVKVSVSGIDL